MTRHVWSVLCSRSVIDRDSNNLSLHNVIERLTIRGELEPGTVTRCPMELVSLWSLDESADITQSKARLTLLTPSGTSLGSEEYSMDLSVAPRLRHRTRLDGIPVEESGEYRFVVELQVKDLTWEQVARVPLSIVVDPLRPTHQ